MLSPVSSFLSISLLVFVLDFFTKTYVSRNLYVGQSVPLIKNIFYISLVHNRGIAFGLFKDQTIFFVSMSLLVVGYILVDFMLHIKDYALIKRISLGLILGGACGNLLDRLCLGYIVDFIDFRIWPVFNIADSAITIGIALFAFSILSKPKGDRTNASSAF